MSSHSYYHAIAFISDIHSNLEALDAVLEDIEKFNVSSIYCLGDIVGYGPDPQPCLQRLEQLQESGKLVTTIAGNHDMGVYENNYSGFSESATLSNQWTREKIKDSSQWQYLEEICQTDLIRKVGRFWLVHSTLEPSPEQWAYLKLKNAAQNFVERKVVFVGHSHIPAIYSKYGGGMGWNPINLFGDDGNYYYPSQKSPLLPVGESTSLYRYEIKDPFPTMLVNVGSVGQPRDDNPNACYVLYLTVDHHSYIEYRHVGYDVAKTVAKHKERGLSCDERLATRLVTGGNNTFEKNADIPEWFTFGKEA